MAALTSQLPRGIAKAHSALRSISHLEWNASRWTRAGEEIFAYSKSDYGIFSSGKGHPSTAVNFPEENYPVDVRPDASCYSSRERCLELLGSNPECQSFRQNLAIMESWERVSSRIYQLSPSSYHFRSMWTAVSTNEKSKPEVDNEELDSKISVNKRGRTRDKSSKVTRGEGKGRREADIVVEDAEKVLGEDVDVEGEAGKVPAEGIESTIYTSTKHPSQFNSSDINKFYTLSPEHLEQYFGEGLPSGLLKEFQETKESSLLIRARVLQLFDRFQKCLADTRRIKEQMDHGERVRFFASKPRQCLLEGLVKCGKSAALAMLVHWARVQGWLVFYVPKGREWTSIGMYYKNTQTGLWDTPIQAKTALEGFLKSHRTLLDVIPCRIKEPLHLGEGAGVGTARGPQQITLSEDATLRDLVEKGISQSQAAVSCLVRLREEFNLVQDVPVLIVIDEFNSWFTFSGYHESTGKRSRRPIHARELSMVNAFRQMEGPLMMASAYSQSLAVGKLPVHLPGLPKGTRFTIERFDLAEARATLNYYSSRKVTSKDLTEEDITKLFYLTNGNGDELRKLARLL